MNRKKRQQTKLRLRRGRLRLEKHARRFEPALKNILNPLLDYLSEPDPGGDWLPEPDEPDIRLPSPYVQERTMRSLHEAMKGHHFSGIDEMNAYLATLTGPGFQQALTDKIPRDDPKWQAQELAYQALEADGRSRREQLARRALALDPDCVDALCALASVADSLPARLSTLRAAIEAGERTLGPEFFEVNSGRFWGILETRPYMRARFDLACVLLTAEDFAGAISHFEALLELNPNDNQGVRDFLLGTYFSVEDLDGAARLLDRYEGGGSAIFLWGRVLERYLTGDFETATMILREAREENIYVERYITGRRRLPHNMPAHYARSRESEALYCSTLMGGAWQRHPDAIDWLPHQP